MGKHLRETCLDFNNPKEGDIAKSRHIGKKGTHSHIYHACEGCGKLRWIELQKGKPTNARCSSCGGLRNEGTWNRTTEPKVGDTTRGRFIGKGAKSTLHTYCKCPKCGVERWIQSEYAGHNPMCVKCSGKRAPHRSGKDNPNWRGGKTRSKNGRGYIQLYLNKEHPCYHLANENGHILEHRLVMAQHLGRPLRPGEVVHHKNHIPNDNRLENLELVNQEINIAESLVWQDNKRLRKENANLRKEIERLKEKIHA